MTSPSPSPTAAARALLAQATPGDWRVEKCDWADDDEACYIVAGADDTVTQVLGDASFDECHHIMSAADAALIAAAPTLLAHLCDQLDAAREERAREYAEVMAELQQAVRDRNEWARRSDTALAEAARLREENERLRGLVAEACELADEGWAYAGDYFRDKWDCETRLATIRTEALK